MVLNWVVVSIWVPKGSLSRTNSFLLDVSAPALPILAFLILVEKYFLSLSLSLCFTQFWLCWEYGVSDTIQEKRAKAQHSRIHVFGSVCVHVRPILFSPYVVFHVPECVFFLSFSRPLLSFHSFLRLHLFSSLSLSLFTLRSNSGRFCFFFLLCFFLGCLCLPLVMCSPSVQCFDSGANENKTASNILN